MVAPREHVIGNYYTALQNVPKSAVDLNGLPNVRRSSYLDIRTAWYRDRCHWQRVFLLLIHIFHIIPQEVRSPNVTESHCNLNTASNGLPCNAKVPFPSGTFFLSGRQKMSINSFKCHIVWSFFWSLLASSRIISGIMYCPAVIL